MANIDIQHVGGGKGRGGLSREREIKAFVCKWSRGNWKEKQHCHVFWIEFCRMVLGVETPYEILEFEKRVYDGKKVGYIDVYIPDTRVIIEQKSPHTDLYGGSDQSDKTSLTPFRQAERYSKSLPNKESADIIITCNFREFHIHDMNKERGKEIPVVVKLDELPEQYTLFECIVNKRHGRIEKERKISEDAGHIIGEIYNALLDRCIDKNDPKELQNLNKFCVRLVFCLYAEDALLFEKNQFYELLSACKGTESVRRRILDLFKALNTNIGEREDPYDTAINAFPYVNGGLFADNIIIPDFDNKVVELICDKASKGFTWERISPTIFGNLFENTLNPLTRKEGKMHYTSVENIHRVIDPLFLNDLNTEFNNIITCNNSAENKKTELHRFQDELASLVFLDPACGSGNFLTETYISLRRLENKILKKLNEIDGSEEQGSFGGDFSKVKVSISQFYGIEVNDFAVAVAKTALWIADAQMWKETREFSQNAIADFLPLKTQATIVEANALRVDWRSIVHNKHIDYIIGNPPFGWGKSLTQDQKDDIRYVYGSEKVGHLDYVTCWFFLAGKLMALQNDTHTAFVATNSITQGEQVSHLWDRLTPLGVSIDFAYRSFKWEDEAKKTDEIKARKRNERNKRAAVHCVILGISANSTLPKRKIFSVKEEVTSIVESEHINGNLEGNLNYHVQERLTSINAPKNIFFGNMPRGKALILTPEERNEAISKDPTIAPYIRPYFNAGEFLRLVPKNNAALRYCLWLKDVSLSEILKHPFIKKRVAMSKEERLASSVKETRKYAEVPHLFCQMPQNGDENFLLIPRVSSENRPYIPMGFMPSGTIVSDAVFYVPNADLYDFGILSSHLHMVWMRTVTGRLKSDYRYSKELCYNTFVWPVNVPDDIRNKICEKAKQLLKIRSDNSDCSLKQLYNVFPVDLQNAHKELDKAVEKAYGCKFDSDNERVSFLYKKYREYTCS